MKPKHVTYMYENLHIRYETLISGIYLFIA